MESPKWRSEEGKETTTDRKEKRDRSSFFQMHESRKNCRRAKGAEIVALVYQDTAS
jgi:hypothetical protein